MSVLPDFSPAQHDDLSPEVDLLGDDPACSDDEDDRTLNAHDHSLVTAPILTGDVLDALGTGVFPEIALYGRVLSQRGEGLPRKSADGRVFINTNAPFSAVICGAQGSGKSQTTSVLLESVLIQNARLGTLPEPLSALVFHLATAIGGGRVSPCEAAYISSLDPLYGGRANAPPVTVLVLPNNLPTMRRVYAELRDVRVAPLNFSPQDITGARLIAMLRMGENAQFPLCIEAIMAILRGMEGAFDCSLFRERLLEQILSPRHKATLSLRLSLLDSCLQGGTPENSVVSHFRQGQLTIVDLSSPFMDGSSACGFFDMIFGLFVDADMVSASQERIGKLVVLDEAHKYLSDPESSQHLTASLLSVIRQQRRHAIRVIISTQEPTVVPHNILDLCSFIIAHRFSSPKWLKHLFEHVSDGLSDELWKKIISLSAGQGVLFSPGGLALRAGLKTDSSALASRLVAPLGQGYLVVRSRLRVTHDGGHSILAMQAPYVNPRVARNDSDEGTGPVAPPTPDSAHDFIRETTPARAQPSAPPPGVPLTPVSVSSLPHESVPSGPHTSSPYSSMKQDTMSHSVSPTQPDHCATSSTQDGPGAPETQMRDTAIDGLDGNNREGEDHIALDSANSNDDFIDRLVAFLYEQQDAGRVFVSLTSAQSYFALTEFEILPFAQAAARREAVVLFGRADGSVALCLPEAVAEASIHIARWVAGEDCDVTLSQEPYSTSRSNSPPEDPSRETVHGASEAAEFVDDGTNATRTVESTAEVETSSTPSGNPHEHGGVGSQTSYTAHSAGPSQSVLAPSQSTSTASNQDLAGISPGRIAIIQQRLVELLREECAAGNLWTSITKARTSTKAVMKSSRFLLIAQQAAQRGLVVIRQSDGGRCSFTLGPSVGSGSGAASSAVGPSIDGEPAAAAPSRPDTPEYSLADLIPLLDYMRQGRGHLPRQEIRQHFRDTVGKPDVETDSLISMACKEELVVSRGEGYNAWVRLPEHQAVEGCGLCAQGRG